MKLNALWLLSGFALFLTVGPASPGQSADGPRIVRVEPLGEVAHPFDLLRIRFDRPIQPASFTLADLAISGSGGALAPVGLSVESDGVYRLDLTGLTGTGLYRLEIGPEIQDASGQAMPAPYRGVLVSGGTSLGVSDPTWDGWSVVLQGGSSVIDGDHAFTALTLLGGAVLSHSAATAAAEYRLELTISQELWIDATSAIDVTGKGYLPTRTVGNTTQGASTGASGGTHGGLGLVTYNASTNPPYGDYLDPSSPGAGGANPNGGAGGGVVRIAAASVVLDGAVRAAGAAGHSHWANTGGGGAGGSIRLEAGVLSGAGLVSAVGGAGPERANDGGTGGSGGGGRVALFVSNAGGFDPARVTAYGGVGGTGPGAAGTVYLKLGTAPGELRIDGGDGTAATYTPLGLPSDPVFSAPRLVIVGTATVAAPEHNLLVRVDDLEVLRGGTLTHRPTTATEEFRLDVEVVGQLRVDGSSAVDASGKGYLPGRTVGNATQGAAVAASGGTHAGLGWVTYNSSTNEPYGDFRDPRQLGSGGGEPTKGGAGGGLIRIRAASASIDGAVRADGAVGYSHWTGVGGGGSGGGIRLDVGTLSGTGLVSASGGPGPEPAGGGGTGGSGGGGRVALYCGDRSGFDVARVTAHGGQGGTGPGAVGTVYLRGLLPPEELRVDSHGTPNGMWTSLGNPSDTELTVERLVLAGAVAAPHHDLPLRLGSMALVQSAKLTHRPATKDQVYSLDARIAEELSIEAGSAIDVSGRGYLAGYTQENLTDDAATGAAGGSFGGLGGVAYASVPNVAYGDAAYPAELGSGGGNPDKGGAGGGRLRLSAGRAQVDGGIRADGAVGLTHWTGTGGSGSGGSILLTVGDLAGSGAISASGGSGPGGGGGGGRVAVYAWGEVTLPPENVTAAGGAGGSGSGSGAAGTVVREMTPLVRWAYPPSRVLHGTTLLRWDVMGLDPGALVVDVEAVAGSGTYVVAAAADPLAGVSWDTTGVPDGPYEVRARFVVGGRLVADSTRGVFVNNSLVWRGGRVTGTETWSADRVQGIDGVVVIGSGATLTISAGAVVKFLDGARILLETGGTLTVDGTEEEHTVLTSLADDSAAGDSNEDGAATVPGPGDWRGFDVRTGSQLSLSAWAEVRYAQTTHTGTVTASETWVGTHLHRVKGELVVPNGVTLTIEPGAVVKFDLSGGLAVRGGGRLIAAGTVGRPVVFTSFRDDSAGGDTNRDGTLTAPAPGDWRWIYANSGEVSLTHAEIRYAGGPTDSPWNQTAAVRSDQGASLTLDSCWVKDAFYDGVLAQGGVATLRDSLVTGADRGLVAWLSAATVHVLNCTFDDNRIGVLAHGGALDVTNSLVTNSLLVGIDRDILPNPTVRYSDVWSPEEAGAQAYRGVPSQTGLQGNVSADPKYVNRAAGNYRLGYLSPAIDAADGLVAPETDFAGAPRYDDPRTADTGTPAGGGAVPDTGAFEFVETAASSVDLVVATAAVLPGGSPGTAEATWTVENRGTGPAQGAWHDDLYLSSDRSWSPDDAVVYSALHSGEIGPGQSYRASARFDLPSLRPGNYYLLVRTNPGAEVFEGVGQRNNVDASVGTIPVTLPQLSLESALSGTLQTSGEVRYFELSAPPGGFSLELASAEGSAVELYVRQGQLPTPQEFDHRGAAAGSSSQSVFVGEAASKPIYVMVRAVELSAPSDFQLTARAAVLEIRSVSPALCGNSGDVTLSIRGARFDLGSTPELVDAAGERVSASRVYFTDAGLLSATFDLRGRPLGKGDVVVRQADGTVTGLPGGVELVSGQPGRFAASLSVPGAVRAGRDFTLYVEYRNDGLQDLKAPVLRLRAPPSLATLSLCRCPSTTAELDLVAAGPEAPAGVLPPGAVGRIPVYGHALAAGSIGLQLDLGVFTATSIDWPSLEPLLRPPDLSDGEWQALYGRLRAEIGEGWAELEAVLSEATTSLPPVKGSAYSLEDVFSLVVDRARAELNPSVTGRLFLDDLRHPQANARVLLWDEAKGLAVDTVTLTDGTFLFPVVADGTYALSAEGFALDSAALVRMAGQDVALPPAVVHKEAGALSGWLLRSPEGGPVEEAVVTAQGLDGVMHLVETAEDGSFWIEGLTPGPYTVGGAAEGMAQCGADPILLGPGGQTELVTLTTGPAASISGAVTGLSGPAPAGSVVSAVDGTGTVAGFGEIAANGTYVIAGLSGGTYDLVTDVAGMVRGTVNGVQVAAGSELAGVEIALTPGGVIEGTLTEADGQPLPTVLVRAAVEGRAVADALTEADGGFRLAGLPPGTYTLSAEPKAHLPVEAEATVVAGQVALVPLAAAAGGVLRGRVLDGGGAPLAGFAVATRTPGGDPLVTGTAGDGSYAFRGLPAGDYTVHLDSLSDEGPAQTTAPVSEDAETVADFTVPKEGRLHGKVTEADGATPVPNAIVEVSQGGLPVDFLRTDSLGRYEAMVLSRGTYDLAATAPGKAFAPVLGLDPSAGGDASTDFAAGALTRTGSLVDGDAGSPISGVTVTLLQVLPGGSLGFLAEAVTDADGLYTVAGLAAGDYTLVAEPPGKAVTEGRLVVSAAGLRALKAGAADLPPVVVPSPTDMDGRVVAVDGSPIAGAEVNISRPGESNYLRTVITDENGQYSVQGLPPGSYDVGVNADGHQPLVVGTVTTTADRVAHFDSQLTPSIGVLRGEVRSGDSPVGRATVISRDARGRVLEMRVTDPHGRFELDRYGPGIQSVVVTSIGNRPVTADVPLDVSADFVVPTSRVTVDLCSGPSHLWNEAGAAYDSALNLAPRGIEWIYEHLYRVQRAPEHPTELPALGSPLCASYHRNATVALRNVNDQFRLWQAAQANNQNNVARAEMVGQWLILGREIAGVYLTVASATAKLPQTIKQMREVQRAGTLVNIVKSKEILEKWDAVTKWADRLDNGQGFLNAVETLYQLETKPPQTDPEQIKQDEYDRITAMKDIIDALHQGVTELVEGSKLIGDLVWTMEHESQMQNGNVKDVLASLGGVLGVIQVGIQAYTACDQTFKLGEWVRESKNLYQRRFAEYIASVIRANRWIDLLKKCNDTARSGGTVPPPPRFSPEAWMNLNGVAGADPNQKTGPAGVGPRGYVQARTLQYRIDFENDPRQATAPAQDVTVTDVLDADLDLATFEFQSFGFRNKTYDVPPGLSAYETTIDLRPTGTNLTVKVSLGLDRGSRTVRVSFRSLDPLTGQPPEDPFAGFLPVNGASHEGEGFVTFLTRPAPGIATGAVIENQAEIVFDVNAPLKTNLVVNELDSVQPVSRVAALPPVLRTEAFAVSWSGEDGAGSGVASYDVYVSVDAGAFGLWLGDTEDTSAIYQGAYGHAYAFYSVARDQAGNVEEAPGAADAVAAPTPNHPPTLAPLAPRAVDEGKLLCLRAAAVDPDGDTVSVSIVSGRPLGATWEGETLCWVPSFKAAGAYVIFFEADDGQGGKDDESVAVTVNDVPQAPAADAGPDQLVEEGAVVTLDASNSHDVDGTITRYQWTAAPGVTLSDATTKTPTFTAPAGGASGVSLLFALEVADNDEMVAVESVYVNVRGAENPHAPRADAGPDQTVYGGDPVTLDGRSSSDEDVGQTLMYHWEQVSGPVVTLSDISAPAPAFTAPAAGAAGVLVFELTVNDPGTLVGTDRVTVNVLPAGSSLTAPVADAGPNQPNIPETTAGAPTVVTLDGSGSTDADGSLVSWEWRQVLGPAATLSDPAAVVTTFRAPSIGVANAVLEFELTVRDNDGLRHSDEVLVNVSDVNVAPTADAGSDQTVDEGTALVTLDGSGSFDPDGTITAYLWTQKAGPSVTLSDPAAAGPRFTAPAVEGDQRLTFELRVTDDVGAQDTDAVTVTVKDVGGGGTIVGRVTETASGEGIRGVTVSTTTGGYTTTTDGDGTYTLSDVAPGSYTLTASKAGYSSESRPVVVTPEPTTRVDFVLARVAAAPGAPNVPAVSSTDAYTVNWAASDTPGASYELEEATDAAFTAALRQVYAGPASSAAITGRTFGATYYYRVRALAEGLTGSDWVAGANGCAVTRGVTATPGAPKVPKASTKEGYTVSWKASRMKGGRVSYELQEATDPTSSDGWHTVYPGPGSKTSVKIFGGSNGVTYYYRVRALKAEYSPSQWVTGANGCPLTLVVAKPGKLSVPKKSVTGAYTVKWGSSKTKDVMYDLEEATDPAFTDATTVYRGSDRLAAVTGRSSGVTHYYRVRASKPRYAPSEWRVTTKGCFVP